MVNPDGARAHHELRHPRQAGSTLRSYGLLTLVLLALMIGVGARYISPAAAEAGYLTETVGNFTFFHDSAESTVGIINNTTQTSLEQELTPENRAGTLDELTAILEDMTSRIRTAFGWDLTVATDRTRMMTEVATLGQAVDTIPEASLQTEANAPLRDLRNVMLAISGNDDCQSRCLLRPQVKNRIVATLVGTAIRKMLYTWVGLDNVGTAFAIMTVALIVSAFINVILDEAEHIPNISTESLRASVTWATVALLLTSRLFLQNADEAAGQKTVKAELQKAADAIATATPAEPAVEESTDYDLVKDEL